MNPRKTLTLTTCLALTLTACSTKTDTAPTPSETVTVTEEPAVEKTTEEEPAEEDLESIDLYPEPTEEQITNARTICKFAGDDFEDISNATHDAEAVLGYLEMGEMFSLYHETSDLHYEFEYALYTASATIEQFGYDYQQRPASADYDALTDELVNVFTICLTDYEIDPWNPSNY